MRIVIFLGFYGMMPISYATFLVNMVGKVNETMRVCWSGRWSVGGVSESDIRSGGDYSLVSLKILRFGEDLYVSV